MKVVRLAAMLAVIAATFFVAIPQALAVNVNCDGDTTDRLDIENAVGTGTGANITLDASCTYWIDREIHVNDGVTLTGAGTSTVIRPVAAQAKAKDCISADEKDTHGSAEAKNVTFDSIKFTDCSRAVSLGNGSVAKNSTFDDNLIGVKIGGFGTSKEEPGEDAVVKDNTITNNDQFGIQGEMDDTTFSASRPLVADNVLDGNGDGDNSGGAAGNQVCGINGGWNGLATVNCAQTKFIEMSTASGEAGPLICNNTIRNSSALNDGVGIWFDVSQGDQNNNDAKAFVYGNTVFNSNGGPGDNVRIEVTDNVTVGGSSTVTCDGTSRSMANTLYESEGDGVEIINSDGALVKSNVINCAGTTPTGTGYPVKITYTARAASSGRYTVTNNTVNLNDQFLETVGQDGDLTGYNASDDEVAGTDFTGNVFGTNNHYFIEDGSGGGSLHFHGADIPDTQNLGEVYKAAGASYNRTGWQDRDQDTSGTFNFNQTKSNC